jgi:hypothetical protein
LFEGAGGAAVVGAFMLENHLPGPVEAATKASKLRSPSGESFDLTFLFDPPSIMLKPGEKALIRASVSIPETLSPDTPYTGYLSVPEIKGATVPIEVRRRL